MNEHIVSKALLNDFIKNHEGQRETVGRPPMSTDRFERVEDLGVRPYADDLAYLKSFALNKSRQRKSELMKDRHTIKLKKGSNHDTQL